MSRHPNGGCGSGLHETGRAITEHQKYDNNTAGFQASEPRCFPSVKRTQACYVT